MTPLQKYAKFIVALIGFALTTAISLDWGFDFPRWVPALSSFVTAVGVYLFPNRPADDDRPAYRPRRAMPDDIHGVDTRP